MQAPSGTVKRISPSSVSDRVESVQSSRTHRSRTNASHCRRGACAWPAGGSGERPGSLAGLVSRTPIVTCAPGCAKAGALA